MPRISVPTTARLPSSLRVDPSNAAASKILSRLSRISLATLALDWLDENHLPLAAPYLRRDNDEDEYDDLDDFYPPARSPGALQELYADLQARKGSKREVLDRVTEGDWRHGLTLYQLAMADLQYLYDHPTSQKWSAYRIVPLKTTSEIDDDDQPTQEIDKESLVIPRFHPSTFLRSLQETVLPDIKAHYNFDRHKTLPLLLLRIFILDSPYNTNLSVQSSTGAAKSAATNFDVSRTVYIAFPDSSPYIYISRPQVFSSAASTSGPGGGGGGGGGESKSLRTLIVEGIPKALSCPPHQRFTLKPTNLTTKNLNELLDKRGGTRTNSAGGGWSIYADESVKESPLDTVLPLSPPLSDSSDEGIDDLTPPDEEEKKKERRVLSPASARDERALKRARLVAKGRFGNSGKINDGKGVERVDIIIEDAFPLSSSSSRKRKRQGQTYDDDNDEQDASRRPGRGGKGRKSAMELALGDDEDGNEDQGQHPGQRKEGDQRGSDDWRPNVKVIFHGAHVFAGLRQLVEKGVIDGERMPGWMTGEEGVTMGAVRNGRIRGYKGSGL